MGMADGRLCIDSLVGYLSRGKGANDVEVVETHISWVILAGDYAWKIKKSLNLGFLDFSTLEKRRFYCEEELRLNRRLAPDWYLEVVPVTRTVDGCMFLGDGPVVDYAVKMKRFNHHMQLDRLLHEGMFRAEYMDAFAESVARFHQFSARASAEHGRSAQVCGPARDNFRHVESLRGEALPSCFLRLKKWTSEACKELQAVMEIRRQEGWVRECHGDLHLANMAWVDETPLIFDCIEFDEDLRWIDVMSEVAFLFMDLAARGHEGLGWRFLDVYLAQTGDYEGLRLLQFYLVYRAMVRAKIAVIRAAQMEGDDGRKQLEDDFQKYLQLAEGFSKRKRSRLIITRGMSGSGKSVFSRCVVEEGGFVRLRSDVERKRLFGGHASCGTGAAPGEGIYTRDMSRKTYERLRELASMLLDAGFSVVVDATFLQQDQRILFRQLAEKKSVPFHIVELMASEDALQKRVLTRCNDVSDADLQVLEYQYKNFQPLQEIERDSSLTIDTEVDSVKESVRKVLNILQTDG